jgi:hypothetical protein
MQSERVVQPAVPADIQRILDDLERADSTATALIHGMSDEQFNWRPDGGTRWSIGQCLEHLAVTNELYGAAMRGTVERARQSGSSRRGELKPGFFGQKFVNSLEPPVKRRGRAPSQVKPSSTLTRDEIVSRYHRAHEQLRQTAIDAAAIDANRATFANPFLKIVRVKVSTGLHVISAHDRRHLWQAESVTKDPLFPRT